MVTINTTDDLLRALAENPRWKEAVRREILTEELLALPARFDSFVATTQAFMDKTETFMGKTQAFMGKTQAFMGKTQAFMGKTQAFMDKTETFMVEQRQINASTAEFITEQKEFNARTDRRIERVQNDISNLRADYARRNAVNEAFIIAMDMGFRLLRSLASSDLWTICQAGDATGISANALRSFYRADLVLEVADGNDAIHYIAVEVSYTADERDTGRALRNAGYLARFTGRPAHTAIASVRNDHRIQPLIDSGEIYWHQLEDRDHPVE